eukprot:scaffold77_cov116-Isochrysis_galbana.AAC.11
MHGGRCASASSAASHSEFRASEPRRPCARYGVYGVGSRLLSIGPVRPRLPARRRHPQPWLNRWMSVSLCRYTSQWQERERPLARAAQKEV